MPFSVKAIPNTIIPEKMRKNQGVELVLKPINMHGGGYSNFLRQIKKEAQTNYLARFI